MRRLLVAHTIPGADRVPAVTGFEIAYGIGAIAALIGSGVAIFVTPQLLRRRERLVVAATDVVD